MKTKNLKLKIQAKSLLRTRTASKSYWAVGISTGAMSCERLGLAFAVCTVDEEALMIPRERFSSNVLAFHDIAI